MTTIEFADRISKMFCHYPLHCLPIVSDLTSQIQKMLIDEGLLELSPFEEYEEQTKKKLDDIIDMLTGDLADDATARMVRDALDGHANG